MRRICKNCISYCYDVFSKSYIDGSFCGQHGREFVTPDQHGLDLGSHGFCGFSPKKSFNVIQLELFNF